MNLDLFPALNRRFGTQYKIIEPEFLLQLQSFQKLGFGIKTTGSDPFKDQTIGISFSTSPKTAYYLPFISDDPLYSLDSTLDALRTLFKRTDLTLYFNDAKYDLQFLLNHSITDVECRIFDVMIATQLLNYTDLDLKYFFERLLYDPNYLANQSKEAQETDIDVGFYAAMDADYTLRLGDKLEADIKTQGITDLFRVEMAVLKALLGMERKGVKIDVPWLKSLEPEYTQRIESLRAKIWEITGEFNINSTDQLSKKLFDEMKFPTVRATKTGNSVDSGVLQELKKRTAHSVFDLLLDYRAEETMFSTFVKGLQRQVDEYSRAHTRFLQCVSTGRLSSSNPNLQNLPDTVRRGIIPEEGNVILSLDYSQIELRVLAHFSKDATLNDSFRKGEDIHRRTASEIYSVKPEDVTKEMRQAAKTMNFALVYGAGEWSVGASLGISVEEARAFMNRYFDRYPGVRRYIAEMKAFAHRKGFVETLLKRRIPIRGINSPDWKIVGRAERIAINAPIQGSAADIVKLAMARVLKAIENTEIELILQVHDELVFEVPETDVLPTAKMLKQIMEHPPTTTFDVPLVADAEYGKSYGELTPINFLE